MKVPVYESKAPVPTQGTGRFLTAQLDAGAMMAPGRMFAQQGEQLAKAGNEIAEFGLKKAEIGAKSEALAASSALQVKLAEKSAAALRNPNPAAAEAAFASDSKNLIQEYSKTLSSSMARRAFSAEAARSQATARIDFIKENNKRAVEATKANLNQEVEAGQKIVSDTSQSDGTRLGHALDVITSITLAGDDLGPEETFKKTGEAYENMTQNTLASLMSAPNADVLAIVTGFREGTLTDVILDGAVGNLSEEQKMKIGLAALKQANAIIKGRKSLREQAEAASNAANDSAYKSIINVTSATRDAALKAHQTLLAANWYTPTQRTAAEARLELDSSTSASKFPDRSGATDDAMSVLDVKETLNTLEWEDIERAKQSITYDNYKDILNRFESDRNLGKDEAVELFKDVYKYTEESDAALLKSPSRMAFRQASKKIKSFVVENPKASFGEVMAEADKIVTASKDTFIQAARKYRQEQLRVNYSNLGVHRASIPEPTPDNLEEVKKAVAARLANNGGTQDQALNAFNILLLDEVQMQAFE